jgi:hypothetical protein
MVEPTVLLLRCPRCGGSLSGTQHDVVFWCAGCGVPLELAGSGFLERPVRLAQAALPQIPADVYLPLWAFRVRYACQWQDGEKEARARLIPAVEWVYVTGFAIHNAAYFGDPGMIFTERRVSLETAAVSGRAGIIVGCTRSQEEARARLEPQLLAIIDRRVDITGLELSCQVSEVIFWGIPFHDDGTAFRDSILDLKIPAAALTELAGIRACAAKR